MTVIILLPHFLRRKVSHVLRSLWKFFNLFDWTFISLASIALMICDRILLLACLLGDFWRFSVYHDIRSTEGFFLNLFFMEKSLKRRLRSLDNFVVGGHKFSQLLVVICLGGCQKIVSDYFLLELFKEPVACVDIFLLANHFIVYWDHDLCLFRRVLLIGFKRSLV